MSRFCPRVTFVQEQQSSYSAAGVFKLAMWPYGIKLLWSPVVDSLYLPSCGRRKTWIVPLQLVVAGVLWHISQHLQQWITSYDVSTLAAWFGIIVLLSATQDIAVDGWALQMLSRRNLSHAASAQTIGLTAGYFVSYTLLLAFSSEAFGSIITVPTFMRCLALCFVVRCTPQLVEYHVPRFPTLPQVVTLLLPLQTETQDASPSSIASTYKQIAHVVKLPAVLRLALLLMLCKVRAT